MRRVAKARAREKAAAGLRLRTSGYNCPLCAQPLPRIAGGRVGPRCASCGAHAVRDKSCAQCHREGDLGGGGAGGLPGLRQHRQSGHGGWW